MFSEHFVIDKNQVFFRRSDGWTAGQSALSDIVIQSRLPKPGDRQWILTIYFET